MKGWNGKLLRVNLTKGTAFAEEYSEDLARRFIGGRGFAIKLLWDELEPGVDPLGPKNILIFATGPLTGHVIPNSGKMVVASKSPLTGGYGDGNLGSWASVNLRKAGIDAVVVSGRSEKPVYLHIENDKYSIKDASDLWGQDSFTAEAMLKERHGRASGVLLIGPSGENLCRVSTVVSQEGRAGGRPGMGAVMGSKNLKAVVLLGTKALPAHDIDELNRLGKVGYNLILEKQSFKWWKRQGTMAILEWCQEASTLPTRNFREGVFEEADAINGYSMENTTVRQKGCPNCNMTCGNVVLNVDGAESELDYENVAMLGSNIGLGDLKQIATLNRMCDELGLDTIGAGACIAFAMEASEKGLISEKIGWGDFDGSKKLLEDLAYMRGLGATLGLGTLAAAENIGGGASDFTIEVKGLECSAYNCHLCPGMALSFGTSPIGAHHKDAWIISWEISSGTRTEYNAEKAEKVIELQRIRGGMFESLVTCRFPWIELGFELDHYTEYFKAATGVETTLDKFWELGDRIYALIRAFWVREYEGAWGRKMDYPPKRWFDEPTTQGSLAGSRLDREKFDDLLQVYYDKRGWDKRGIPTTATMKKLRLHSEAVQLAKYVELR
ncbi:MAG: aldehyde ferredoxin oxidoreductase family protein [Candidatus Bathyarchaeota archaeon]|jgi:aldehyde:ferredoxin oxidoreductase|nr:aldehyde ferredoxin oxidoreductase family protein [Candidatus Bathyarchaeota archaeon]